MIIAPNWVWLHMPKCAGTTIERVLRQNYGDDPAVRFDPIDPANVIWHQNIPAREDYDADFALGDRRVLCAIRRLPDWVLSRIHFEAARPPHHVASRAMYEGGRFYENTGVTSSADATLRAFATPRVDRWLRVEHLHDDLETALGRPLEGRGARSNDARIDYVRDRGFWFTADQLAALYDASPEWARVERDVYGDILR